jgi:hypothetical protein
MGGATPLPGGNSDVPSARRSSPSGSTGMRPAGEGRRGPGRLTRPGGPPPRPRPLGNRRLGRSPTWWAVRDPLSTGGGASRFRRGPRCPRTAPAGPRGRREGRPRGQEGRARGRARGARARARYHGGRPRNPWKWDGRRPGKRAREREEDPAVGSLRPKWGLCELLSALEMARSSHQCRSGGASRPRRGRGARRRVAEVFDASDGIHGRRRSTTSPRRGRDRRGAPDGAHHGRGGPGREREDEAERVHVPHGDEVSERPGNKACRDLAAGPPNLPWPAGVTRLSTPACRPRLPPVPGRPGGPVAGRTTPAAPNAEMAGSMPEAAVGLTGPDERARLVIHGDRGCHHRWPGRASVCEGAGVVRPTSRRGRPPDSSRTGASSAPWRTRRSAGGTGRASARTGSGRRPMTTWSGTARRESGARWTR